MLEESVGSAPSLWATVNSWFTPTVLFLFLNLMIATIALTSSLTKPHHPEQEQEEHLQQHPQRQQQEEEDEAAHHNPQGSPSVLQRLRSINFYSHRSPTTETHFAEQEGSGGDDGSKPFSFARSPSSVLQRLRSLSFYSGNSPPEPASPAAAVGGTRQQKPLDRRTRLSFEETRQEEEARGEEPVSRDGEEKEEDEEEAEEEVGDELSSLDEIYSQLKGAHQVVRTKSDTTPASGEVPTKLPKKMRKSASAKSAFAHFAEEDIVETYRPASAREPKAKVSDDDEEGEEEGEVDAKADDFINRFKQQLKLQRIDSIMRYKDMVHRGGSRLQGCDTFGVVVFVKVRSVNNASESLCNGSLKTWSE